MTGGGLIEGGPVLREQPGREGGIGVSSLLNASVLRAGRCSRMEITVSYLDILFVRALSSCLAHSRSSINHS